jgi:hypothetical protein
MESEDIVRMRRCSFSNILGRLELMNKCDGVCLGHLLGGLLKARLMRRLNESLLRYTKI